MATTVQLDDDQRGRKIVSIGGQSFVLDELVGAKGVEPGVVEVFKCAKGRSQTAARKLHSVKVKTPGQQADDVVRDIKSLLPPPPQDVVVFVNPTSGVSRS